MKGVFSFEISKNETYKQLETENIIVIIQI